MANYTDFRTAAHNLVKYEPAADGMGDDLDRIRGLFDNLIDDVAPHMPNDANAKLAARAIHAACQACILAVIKRDVEV